MKKKYKEQADRCPLQFLYEGLAITTQCESGYRASVNPRLHIEFALMRLSMKQVPQAAPQTVPQQPAAPQPLPQQPSVQEQHAAPQPQPAVQDQPAEQPQPRERRSRTARAGVSLKAVMDDQPQAETAPVQNDEAPSDEALRAKWPELAKAYSDKPRLAAMLSSTTLEISEADGFKTGVFRVVNTSQKDWVESKLLHELEGRYRALVGSMKIYLRVAIAPDDAPQEKKIYMPSDQAKELMTQNDEVMNLVKDLDLDIK